MNPIIKLSNNAANRIKEIMSGAEKDALGVRVSVKSGGCAGMSYDTDKKDYYVLHHDYDKSPKRTDDEDVDFSYFNEQRAYRKRNEYIEGINDWKYLKFLDPTQVEGFKQARDKRQYLSEVTMCPKAIYTLDLTSDIDVDS